jgi:hypothetical protein
MNLKVRNPIIKNFDRIRYWVEFQVNGQNMKIDTTWKEGKCSFGDVIAHLGFSGETTVPTCSYCGKNFVDCEICPEFYYNPVKTQIIANQLLILLQDQLQELPFNFEKPFISSNRGQKLADMIKVAEERGHKIAGIFDDYERYMVSGSAVAPEYNDPELVEDDDMFFMKTSYTVVNVKEGIEKTVTGEAGLFESDEICSYLVPEELLDRTNQFVELEIEWKKKMVLEQLNLVDLHHRRYSTLTFLKQMIDYNFPKDVLSRFLEMYIAVDMLEDTTAIHNQFVAFMEEEA